MWIALGYDLQSPYNRAPGFPRPRRLDGPTRADGSSGTLAGKKCDVEQNV